MRCNARCANSRDVLGARLLAAMLTTLVILSTAVLQGCAASGEDPTAPEGPPPPILIPDTPLETPASPVRAVIDRTLLVASPDYVDTRADALAEADVLMFQLRAILSPDGAENVRRIRAINPDVVVIGSIQLLTIFPHWNDSYHRERMTLGARIWDAVHDRPARTTTGAVAPMWDRMTMLNPMRGGSLDEAMLNEVVEAFRSHFESYPGIADGIMHDYTSEIPWIYPSPEEAGIGDVDLDGDGIGFPDDPAEHGVWIAWQEQLIRRLQTAIGPGLIQIANGRMAIERPSTIRLLAGAYFEDFPTMTWHQSPRYGFDRLHEITREEGLTPRRGRTWNLLAPPWTGSAGYLEMRQMANLLYDGSYAVAETRSAELVAPDDAPIEAGNALGPATHERLADGGSRYVRPYSDGNVVVEFASSGAVRSAGVAPR